MKRKVIVIVGPTASGKTGIGVRLAREFDGEIISADSRQIYRGLDIGTGKDLAEYGETKHHLIDICDPDTEFSVFDWVKLVREAIEDIFSRGKTPIVVGGTGLYIQALTEGFMLEKAQNPKSKGQNWNREQLEETEREELQKILKELDSETYGSIDQNNPHRLIRAIERAQSGLKPVKVKPDFEVLEIGVTWPRDVLHSRIDDRVEEWIRDGFIQEVKNLIESGVDPNWLLKLGLEYRVVVSYIIQKSKVKSQNCNSNLENLGTGTLGEMKQKLKERTHQFARRQETWFRRFPEIIWENDLEKIEKLADKFLS